MATTTKLSFPGDATVFVQAFSNAAFNQAVTIQPPSGESAVFPGSGENNAPQSLTTQWFLTLNSGGQPSFVVPSSGGEYTISVTGDGATTSVMSNVNSFSTPDNNGQIIIGWVSSEDSDDDDWNDSVVIFTSFLPASQAKRIP